MRQQLIGFESLFGRFLQETGPSVLWDKVVPLPSDRVSNVFCCCYTLQNLIWKIWLNFFWHTLYTSLIIS